MVLFSPLAPCAGPSTSPSDLRDLARRHLSRWSGPLTSSDVDRAERWLVEAGSKMLTVPGGWRLKIVNGSLYVKYLHRAATWAERTSVLRIFLLLRDDASRRLPDVDVVYAASDQDPSPSLGYPPCGASPGASCGRPIPLLTNAIEQKGRKASLPVPEFSWVGWRHQPPWCRLVEELAPAAAAPWASRRDALYFSGSLLNGRWRRRLRRLVDEQAKAGGADLHVRDVQSKFFGGAQPRWAHGQLAEQANRSVAPRALHEACGWRYVLSIPGYGYSNRLRALLACGSTVIHLRPPWAEYFEPLLRDNCNVVVVDKVEQILPTLRALRADEGRARRIAESGRALALGALAWPNVLGYLRAMLEEYAARRTEPVAPPAPGDGFTRVGSARELMDVAGLCRCREPGGGRECAGRKCCVGWDCASKRLGCGGATT